MKLKDIYPLVTGVVLISIPEDDRIRYGNAYLPEPTKEIMERSVKEIEPFYKAKGLYKYGVIIRLKKLNKKAEG